MKKNILYGFFFLIFSCQLNADNEPFEYMFRSWEWEYSLYKNAKITPQSLGYTQQLKYGNDTKISDFLAFYKDEKLVEQTKKLGADKKNKTTAEFNLANGKSIRMCIHFLGKKVDAGWTLETTNLYVGKYSSSKDTIRHFYRMRSDIK